MLAFAKQSKWRLLIVDDTGALLGATADTYRPPNAMRMITELRRPTCSFPDCTIRAEWCDLDHRMSWAQGGCTGQCNLDPLCRNAGELGVWGWCQVGGEGVGGWGGFVQDSVVGVFGELDAQAVEVGFAQVFGDLEGVAGLGAVA